MFKKIIFILSIIFVLSTIINILPAFCATQAAEYICEFGITFYRAGKYDDALHEFNKVLLIEPDNQLAKNYIKLIFLKEMPVSTFKRPAPPTEQIAEKFVTVPPAEQIPKRIAEQPTREEIINQTLNNLSRQEIPTKAERKPPITEVTEMPSLGKGGEKTPVALSGEYRLGVGIESDGGFIWKDTNADRVGVPREKNWRYLWGDNRHNTYDPKIYDRFELAMQTQFDNPLNAFMQIDIDPWTFVGKNHVTINSIAGGDVVDMDLKYWSADHRTIDETYRSKKGNIIAVKPIKVHEGKTTTVYAPTGLSDWGTVFNNIESMEINRDYRPIRKFWFDYIQEDYSVKVFPISDQFEALTSDDPLVLSNKHVYWEESPWLDEYEPSRIFEPDSGITPVKKGKWIRRMSFFTKDSSDDYPHRLTSLRGISFKSNPGNYSLETTMATPMSLWDDYENSNSIDAATRLKIPLTQDLQAGFTQTSKMGVNGGSFEAFNHTLAADLIYKLSDYDTISVEVATSYTEIQEAKDFASTYYGPAAKLAWIYDGSKKKEDWDIPQLPYYNGVYKGEIYAVHMDADFYPGLSNYRYTRRDDPTFSRNIYFAKIADVDAPLMWGDGVDRGRNALGFKLGVKAFDERLDNDLKYRNVHQDNGSYVESVVRNETTYKATSRLTTKLLGYYQHLPKTMAGYDPLLYAKTMYSLSDYFSEEDIHPENSSVVGDKNPSVGAFGFGAKYDLIKELLSVGGSYERTNDPLDFPRALFNNTYVTADYKDGYAWDKVMPLVYDQKFFGSPPYKYYSIGKTKFIYTPTDRWEFILSYTYNENKHTSGLNGNINHTGLETTYMPTDKWTFWCKYIYSKLIDVYKQNKYQSDDYYEPHHNFFFGSEYKLNKDESFTLLYGEFASYDDPHGQANWTLSALDTQHLFRMFYRRKF